MLTYGDGVTDLNITALLRFHKAHGKLATVTTVRSPAHFGRITFSGDQVTNFYEKPESGEGWINGGYFVLNRRPLDYIEGTTRSGSWARSSGSPKTGSSWDTATPVSGPAWTP